jgi:hypothetical protein
MASASRSAAGVVSTRNAILSAHPGKELGGGASAARPHVFIPLADALDGLLIVGAFPFERHAARASSRASATRWA